MKAVHGDQQAGVVFEAGRRVKISGRVQQIDDKRLDST